MSFMKGERGYQGIIDRYIEGKKQFIDSIRAAITKQTLDLGERQKRLETFDALLLKATYASEEELEDGFRKSLPLPHDPTISFIVRQLREVNGFCNQSFSDEHEGYQSIYNTITFLTSETKRGIREQFSKALTEMVFDKTGTPPANNQCL
ncbi:hypothetical protein [Legionella fallonii]|uniref:Uncharacterized protein n=1 Tax=Legionella fallonii LLAP-10 TaxID=1212491 RepID=A0A098G3I4_9GAMM|nr:hypothetical protein [Legionella fallonii]CEG56559.1 conserved protein of unknown function [Legionella fallonii LLAP-10]